MDVVKGTHLSPEFVSMNPNSQFPVLKDGDFAVFESNAILRYLVEKYGGKDNPLYPRYCILYYSLFR